MFTAGTAQPDGSGETREFETVAIEDEEPRVPEAADEPEAIEEDEPFEEPEGEDWEEAGYDEWEGETGGEEFDEGFVDDGFGPDEIDEDEIEAETGSGDPVEAEPGSSRAEDFKARFAAFRVRAAAVWKDLLERVKETRLPNHEIDGQKVLAGAGIVAVALLVGAGGYVIGKGSGDDLNTARLEGEFAGKRAGAIAGATRGYASGFQKGRDLAFRKAYAASYRRNYQRAYEDAGMTPPKLDNIQVPKP